MPCERYVHLRGLRRRKPVYADGRVVYFVQCSGCEEHDPWRSRWDMRDFRRIVEGTYVRLTVVRASK